MRKMTMLLVLAAAPAAFAYTAAELFDKNVQAKGTLAFQVSFRYGAYPHLVSGKSLPSRYACLVVPLAMSSAAHSRALNAENPAHSTVRLEASEIPSDAIKYTVLVDGIPCGVQGTWKAGAQTWRYHFEYNDKGRGPWVDETIVVNTENIPVSVRVKGHDFFERPVRENFSLVGKTAHWERGGARRTQSLRRPAFYVTTPVVVGQLSAVPDDLAMLTRAMIALSTDRLALLPHGEAHVEETIRIHINTDGAARTLTAVRIAGVPDGAAELVLDEENVMFAVFEGTMTLIRRNFESTLPAIQAEIRATS